MRIPQRLGIAEVRFERAERRDQDAGGGFLADAAAAPALLEGPFLDRPFPAKDVPQAGAGGRGAAADRLDRAPYRTARRLDAQPGASFSRRRPVSATRRWVRSRARSGSSCATAKRARKSSPAWRMPAVIEPRRSMI